jgi:hypothetical protein
VAAAAAGCALAAARGGTWSAAGLAGGAGLAASWLAARCCTGRHPRPAEVLADFLVPALLALAADPGLHIWQIPPDFAGVLRLTGLAAAAGCLAHLALVLQSCAGRRAHPPALASLCVLAAPFLFNWLLLLANPGLVERLGRLAFLGLGGEVFTEIGMAIKAGSPCPHTFVITHCNGAAGYLAPKEAHLQGGYEPTSSPFAPQAADIVIRESIRILQDL